MTGVVDYDLETTYPNRRGDIMHDIMYHTCLTIPFSSGTISVICLYMFLQLAVGIGFIKMLKHKKSE